MMWWLLDNSNSTERLRKTPLTPRPHHCLLWFKWKEASSDSLCLLDSWTENNKLVGVLLILRWRRHKQEENIRDLTLFWTFNLLSEQSWRGTYKEEIWIINLFSSYGQEIFFSIDNFRIRQTRNIKLYTDFSFSKRKIIVSKENFTIYVLNMLQPIHHIVGHLLINEITIR